MANNLKDHLKEVADAIRAKKGTTDLINPQDFAEEIGAISGGGEGGSNIEYLDVSEGLSAAAKMMLVLYGGVVGKAPNDIITTTSSLPAGIYTCAEIYATYVQQGMSQEVGNAIFGGITGIAFLPNIKIVNGNIGETLAVYELLELLGIPREQLDSLPRITEVEFYDLTA